MTEYFIRNIVGMNNQNIQIIMLKNGAQITQYEENPIWQEYLEWVAEGNTPKEWPEE